MYTLIASTTNIQYYETTKGVVSGTFVIIFLWLLFTLIEKFSKNRIISKIKRIKIPLIASLFANLYLCLLLELFKDFTGTELPIKTSIASILILRLGIGWSVILLAKSIFLNERLIEAYFKSKSEAETKLIKSFISNTINLLLLLLVILTVLPLFGISIITLSCVIGAIGIGIGFASRDIISNLISGVLIYFSSPFKIGDSVIIKNRGLEEEGIVESISWYSTKVRNFETISVSIPNFLVLNSLILNRSRLTNRRIKANIRLRYIDLKNIEKITNSINKMLSSNSNIDQNKTIIVSFNEWDKSSINLFIYCFCSTNNWSKSLEIKQRIFLKIASIIKENDSDFAFEGITIYPTPNLINGES